MFLDAKQLSFVTTIGLIARLVRAPIKLQQITEDQNMGGRLVCNWECGRLFSYS